MKNILVLMLITKIIIYKITKIHTQLWSVLQLVVILHRIGLYLLNNKYDINTTSVIDSRHMAWLLCLMGRLHG